MGAVTDVHVLWASLYVKVKSQAGSATAIAAAAKSGMVKKDFILAGLGLDMGMGMKRVDASWLVERERSTVCRVNECVCDVLKGAEVCVHWGRHTG